jgi:hypothetical protein
MPKLWGLRYVEVLNWPREHIIVGRAYLSVYGVRCAYYLSILALLVGASWNLSLGQQVIQRGAFGKPAQVMDETRQWTTPLLVASDQDVAMYIPDVSSPDWLKLNYRDFYDRGYYTISMFTFYRTPEACRQSQIGWGLGDAAHLEACIGIGYRLRTAKIVPQDESATLVEAAMIFQDGTLDPDSVESRGGFRFWHDLDATTRSALEKTTALVRAQMKIYDAKVQSLH